MRSPNASSNRLRRSTFSCSSTKREAAEASLHKSGRLDHFDQCSGGTDGESAALNE